MMCPKNKSDDEPSTHHIRRFKGVDRVLQAGTAVMVDDRGVPRAKCSCGNPLREPIPGTDPTKVDAYATDRQYWNLFKRTP